MGTPHVVAAARPASAGAAGDAEPEQVLERAQAPGYGRRDRIARSQVLEVMAGRPGGECRRAGVGAQRATSLSSRARGPGGAWTSAPRPSREPARASSRDAPRAASRSPASWRRAWPSAHGRSHPRSRRPGGAGRCRPVVLARTIGARPGLRPRQDRSSGHDLRHERPRHDSRGLHAGVPGRTYRHRPRGPRGGGTLGQRGRRRVAAPSRSGRRSSASRQVIRRKGPADCGAL